MNIESKSLDEYLQEIGKEEHLTAEEEAALAQRIRNGDKAAFDKLMRPNLKFVISVAKQYQNQGLSLPELINAGNSGLIKAAEGFDERSVYRFMGYAVWHIKSSILEALSALPNHDPPAADIKEYIVRDFESVSATLTERESDVVKLFFGIGDKEKEIGEKFGLSPQRVRQIREEAVRKIKEKNPNSTNKRKPERVFSFREAEKIFMEAAKNFKFNI